MLYSFNFGSLSKSTLIFPFKWDLMILYTQTTTNPCGLHNNPQNDSEIEN